ncbi:ParA family protein [Geobacillus sp. WSUCF-018B]|uniref:ParA family protein n=1 Tax=Geobacillus sp. WSUCF-018B TaxID=2055939 RepID=UPI000C28374B|nr:ParA family protein [Geobacillus sp. WSUCF-018B]PJW18895.1 hypothetical protein CV944_01445 [Geobacillus sp. WSUCF-018B]
MKVISCFNFKGGVGKSSLLINLGLTLAYSKKKVLFVDLCENSDTNRRLGYEKSDFDTSVYGWLTGEYPVNKALYEYEHQSNLLFIPSDFRMNDLVSKIQKKKDWYLLLKEQLNVFKGHIDFVLIDNHPGRGDKRHYLSLAASDLVLIPCDDDPSTIDETLDSIQAVESFRENGFLIDYFVVPYRLKSKIELDYVMKELKDYKIAPPIRHTSAFKNALKKKQTIFQYNSVYIEKLREDISLLIKKVIV